MKLQVVLLITGLAVMVSANADPADPDWVAYGMGKDDVSFFLRSDIKKTPDGHLQVWTKTLSGSQLNSSMKPGDEALKKAASKIQAGIDPQHVYD